MQEQLCRGALQFGKQVLVRWALLKPRRELQPRIMIWGETLVKQETILMPGGSWSQSWEIRLVARGGSEYR